MACAHLYLLLKFLERADLKCMLREKKSNSYAVEGKEFNIPIDLHSL